MRLLERSTIDENAGNLRFGILFFNVLPEKLV
jgi:hypothetical protein